ncbi:class E sortase [Streptomyces macrosporus]|uniref:class E sortase n=1 Tax=Streptomyces macrosporus TaxID=44032 RepID=UPI003CD094B9
MRPEGTYGSDPHSGDPYDPYAEPGAFEAAVGRLADPLNDPLPGREQTPPEPYPGGYPEAYPPYREPRRYDAYPTGAPTPADPYAPGVHAPGAHVTEAAPAPEPAVAPEPAPAPAPDPVPVPVPDDETMLLRRAEEPLPARPEPVRPPDGGRAARRRARQGRQGRRAQQGRRARRAQRESPMVIASRVVGELFITLGVVMLLFVSYQLWWTNVIADRQAGDEAKKLEQQWEDKGGDRDPGVFSPGQGFAIMHIPRLDVKVPIAEGVDENGVLDRGMVGHYAEEPLKTAMPWDKTGNFAVAGHRNTHGEPFRYINKLDPGDPIVVETRDTYYIYEMTSRLDSTLPSNVGVIDPVPAESGFTEPGRYITLTTCTPEFTSKYRLIVWGKMVEERPRSEGKPDALVR